ncbi:MAG: AraC family transcriptional regulator [Verrucomicrobiota bacterium]
MRKSGPPLRAELLPIPDSPGNLGEIFEAAVLRNMTYGAEGELNRHYIGRAVVLVLDLQGQAEYGDESGRVVPLVPGSCILVDPGLGHRYGPVAGSRWTEMYICFRGRFFDEMEASAQMMQKPVRQLASLADWHAKLADVLPGPGRSRDADACIGRLIAFLTEAFPSGLVREKEDWIAEAKRFLERETVSVAEVTERLAHSTGFAPETLRKRFRQVTGVSMKSWQLAGRVVLARSLLARCRMSQKEIAATLGFSSPQHFSRYMRKATGVTPGEISRRG